MKRSKHGLSHYRLTSLNMGLLYPVMCMEVLPGDSFRHSAACLLRVAPLVSPVMHPVHVSLHHWYVPWRLVWSNWETFITQSQSGLSLPTMPIASGDTALKLFAQAMGIGAEVPSGSVTVQTLPFRAYNMIFNEFYRDQDLTAAAPERNGDTGDVAADYLIRSGAWEKDYFTTARSAPQQGTNTQVVTLGGTTAPVKGLGIESGSTQTTPNITVRESGSTGTTVYANATATPFNTPSRVFVRTTGGANTNPDVVADLSGAGITMDINAWRTAMALQKFREHRNRYGSRYRDLLAFLGINSSDARLDRPEYLGGGKQTISFSEVLSTADSGSADVGSLAGHGISAMVSRPYRRFFEEHGCVISLLVVRPKTVYVNAVPRTFLRRTYSDFWQKELEMLGEQSITNFEVYGDTATPAGVFGYIPRYDEYRHAESSVSGEFRRLLNYWHMGRIFSSQPALNSTFVTSDPTTRIYASAATDQLYAMISHRIVARRLVSKFARN